MVGPDSLMPGDRPDDNPIFRALVQDWLQTLFRRMAMGRSFYGKLGGQIDPAAQMDFASSLAIPRPDQLFSWENKGPENRPSQTTRLAQEMDLGMVDPEIVEQGELARRIAESLIMRNYGYDDAGNYDYSNINPTGKRKI